MVSFCAILFFGFSGQKLYAQQTETEKLNLLLNQWHEAAAKADENTFFGFMSEDCIYIGTDVTEKWRRDELKSWSQKYFERESAWSFKPFDREIYFSQNTAWFDEKLETWMGICRASGVLIKTEEGWKLNHYQLSVTIDNDKIQDFIDLVEKD